MKSAVVTIVTVAAQAGALIKRTRAPNESERDQ
jgi:hypothetical protein